MSDSRKLAAGLANFTPSAREDMARRSDDLEIGKTVELLRRAGQEMYDNPIVNTAIGFSPGAGDLQSGYEAYNSAREGNYGEAGLNAIGIAPGLPALGGMVMNNNAKTRLSEILEKLSSGERTQTKIRDAIDLTESQRNGLDELLGQNYKGIKTPQSIPYYPQHSFDSRVIKDGFPTEDVYRWSVSAADDASIPSNTGGRGAALINKYNDEGRGISYAVEMPIRGDSYGNVWADGIIPRGLFGPNASSKNPLKSPPTASQGLLPKGDNASRVDTNIAQERDVSNQKTRGEK